MALIGWYHGGTPRVSLDTTGGRTMESTSAEDQTWQESRVLQRSTRRHALRGEASVYM